MIEERNGQGGAKLVYSYNTFFFPRILSHGHGSCRRWTRDVVIFSMGILLIPIHWGVHWCLAVVRMSDKKIAYYDSYGGSDRGSLRILANYLKDEHDDKKGVSTLYTFL